MEFAEERIPHSAQSEETEQTAWRSERRQRGFVAEQTLGLRHIHPKAVEPTRFVSFVERLVGKRDTCRNLPLVQSKKEIEGDGFVVELHLAPACQTSHREARQNRVSRLERCHTVLTVS